MRLILSLVLITITSVVAHAAEPAKVGDMIPTNLELANQKGETQSFDALKGKKGLVLIFVRSADWCPYCQVQLLDLRKGEADPILDKGFNVATISYDNVEALNKFATRYKFDFPMLSDEGSETIKAFGILNEDKKPGEFGHGIPHPHVYVIGDDKTILAVLAEEGYKKRPQIGAIVESIENLQ